MIITKLIVILIFYFKQHFFCRIFLVCDFPEKLHSNIVILVRWSTMTISGQLSQEVDISGILARLGMGK